MFSARPVKTVNLSISRLLQWLKSIVGNYEESRYMNTLQTHHSLLITKKTKQNENNK